MNFLRIIGLFTLLTAPLLAARSESLPPPTEKRVYKQVGDAQLEIWIWKPTNWQSGDRRPAIVFYHGGGWRGGNPAAFARQSARLAERGMVALSVEYRLTKTPGVTVADCIADAKSAFRWVRAHARALGIDPDKIAAGGGSAGGHLAATLATVDGFNDPKDDSSINTRPAALVLFNPALKLEGLLRDGDERIRSADIKAADPYQHLKRGHPPTIVLHGEDDVTVPIASVRAYAAKVGALGGACQIVGFPGQVHAFFNKDPQVWETLKHAESFLVAQGFIAAPPGDSSPTAAASAASEKLAAARLLGVRRMQPRKDAQRPDGPTDGLMFAVLVSPTTDVIDEPAIKETRDFLVGGESYQAKTRAALGKTFEPQTTIHDAAKFFAATPALSEGRESPKGSFVLTMNFPGAELETGAAVELTLNVGYKKKADSFVLRTKVPPMR